MEPRQPAAAWQPFTPRGVAAFAGARFGRLLAIQGVVALSVALVSVWVVSRAWFPAIYAAIEVLPRGAEIRRGALYWPTHSPQRLAENPFLAIAVDLEHSGQARSPAHLLVELGERDIRVISLLGYIQLRYPPGRVVAFSRDELKPAWGAWAVPSLAITALGIVAALLVAWALIASVYAGPAWLFAFFANRALNWRGSWMIAAAALLPGAVFMTATLAVYGLGACDPIRFLAAVVLHMIIGAGYAIAGAIAAPRLHDTPRLGQNPFARPAGK